jgi:DMSO/TMAO reductase YedYZ molybdopterin-dependent catalytic subunit
MCLTKHSCSLVENPLTISFKDYLSDYEHVTYPITLVCAGNRRKEQNVVRKTKGFSWGPAGVSTALFTGVVMSDIIKRAKPLRRAKYVCMEGADKLVRITCLIYAEHWGLMPNSQMGTTGHPSNSTGLWILIEASCWLTK